MAYKRNGYTAHDGDKTRKTPRRMRAEHPVIKKSRYKGDDLGEKINDVEDRIEFLMEDASGNSNNPRKARQQEKAIAKLKKRRDQYRAEYKRLNEAN